MLSNFLSYLNASRPEDFWLATSHPSSFSSFKEMPPGTVFPLCLYGEARGLGLLGMLLVGCVVRNRVLRFANPSLSTYKDVCLKKKQFSCFNSDDRNYHSLLNPMEYQAWRLANQAAYDIVTEHRCPDLTNGATQYYSTPPNNPSWTPYWTPGFERTVTLENLVFMKER